MEVIMTGILYGVGVGPGDPELLTFKAAAVIKEADIILAPKTEKKEDSVALSIARPYLKPNAEIVKLVFPMVSDDKELTEAWQSNKEVILKLLKAGKKVVFLTLGDPMFYSTYIYIYRLLEDSGYPIETIPGVTAFCAIGSHIGYPLVDGDNVLTIVPATMEEAKLDKVLKEADNVVLMKVYKNFPQIVEKLQKYNLMSEAVLISRCGLPEEKVVHNLQDVDTSKPLNYLSTILTKRG
jgi:precorrin-2/cobalt-factor-2 C20-methyltransferase